MGSLLLYVLEVLVIAAVVIVIVDIKFRTTNAVSLPPGPPAEPLIGHARLIPQKYQAEFYHEMRRSYGDVLYFNALGKSIVVLNSVEAAVDLMDKRSSIYSDRPSLVMLPEILGYYPSVASLRYGKRFQKHRKLFHSVFSQAQIYTFEDTQTEEARVLVKGLIETPDSYDWLARRFATTLVMKIGYGYQILSDDDEYIKIAENSSLAVAASGVPGMSPPDLFPILKHVPAWVPGAWWSKVGRDWRPAVDALHNIPFDRVRKEMENGTAQPSFVATHLAAITAEGVPTQDDIDDIRGAAGTIFAAGMDTTWTTIIMFIFAMTLFPDKQEKAQQEVDTVVGHNRLPEFSDRSSLPYVDALLQEVLRWYPSVPLGIPHLVMQDDVYKEMFIPKGSVVIANALSMSWDEKVYANPTKFHPERFLSKSAGGDEEPYPISSFGFGRRVCPGRYLADASVWIVLATMLSTVTISKARDEHGHEITPEIAFDVGLAARPKPFKCMIAPRSELATSLVMQTRAATEVAGLDVMKSDGLPR